MENKTEGWDLRLHKQILSLAVPILDRIGKISTSSIFDWVSPVRNSYSPGSPDNIFLVKYVMSQSPAISQPDLGLVSQKYFRLENIDQKIFSQTNKKNATDHPTKRERERKKE